MTVSARDTDAFSSVARTRCGTSRAGAEFHHEARSVENLDSILGQAYSVCATELGAQRNRRSFVLPSRRWSLVPRDAAAHSRLARLAHSSIKAPDGTVTVENADRRARRPDHQWRTQIHSLPKYSQCSCDMRDRTGEQP